MLGDSLLCRSKMHTGQVSVSYFLLSSIVLLAVYSLPQHNRDTWTTFYWAHCWQSFLLDLNSEWHIWRKYENSKRKRSHYSLVVDRFVGRGSIEVSFTINFQVSCYHHPSWCCPASWTAEMTGQLFVNFLFLIFMKSTNGFSDLNFLVFPRAV